MSENCPDDSCERVFSNHLGLTVHWGRKHDGVPPWEQGDVECPHENCQKEFDGEHGLKVHWSYKHDKVPPWEKTDIECPKDDCQTYFETEHGLEVHWGSEHDEIAPWRKHVCDCCGEVFERCRTHLTGGWKFCDQECYGKYIEENVEGEDVPNWQGGPNEYECDNCGERFKRKESNVKGENKFCGWLCYIDWETIHGNGSPYYGPNWEEQREKSLDMYGGVCAYPGCERTECRSGKALHVHHITPLREFDSFEEANRLLNLIPYCAEHHNEMED